MKIFEITSQEEDWILSDVKTGKWWYVKNYSHGDHMARELGLLDYEIYANPNRDVQIPERPTKKKFIRPRR
jgi:hypothetical protein